MLHDIYLFYVFIYSFYIENTLIFKNSSSQKLQNTFSSLVDPLALWNRSLIYYLIIILHT